MILALCVVPTICCVIIISEIEKERMVVEEESRLLGFDYQTGESTEYLLHVFNTKYCV